MSSQSDISAKSNIEQPTREGGKFLNVILHGLYVLYIGKTHIELLTPDVSEHKYYGGNWDKKSLRQLESDIRYRLVGVRESVYPPLTNSDCNLVLDTCRLDFSIVTELSRNVVELPFPREIRPFRPLRGDHLFGGKTAARIRPNGLSICQCLIYPVANFDDVRMWGLDWDPKPKPSSDGKYANLHLWAEPDKDIPPQHAKHAYMKLMEMLPPLDLTLLTDSKVEMQKDIGIPGVDYCEQKGLAEWDVHHGTRPSNCQVATVLGRS